MTRDKLPRLIPMLILGLLMSWERVEGAQTQTALMEKYRLQAGMKITQENAQLVKDLVPEVIYRRLTTGEYTLTIGRFDPPDTLTKVWPPEYYQANGQNAGKYDVDADGGIIEKTTSQRPWPMPSGLPFPILDFGEDPAKVGAKIIWNNFALSATYGEYDSFGEILSTSLRGGPDRQVKLRLAKQFIDFRQDPLAIKRPISYQDIFLFLEPSDAFGSANVTWRWADPKKWDSVWAYSPSVRRVRRLTSANRSDAVLGTEFISDDTNLYAGKVEMFNWKYVGQQAMLMPFLRLRSQAPDDFVAKVPTWGNPSSRFPQVPGAFEAEDKQVTYAFSESPQRYVSWWVPDLIWVPVWTYGVEGFPKDQYYNYGRQIFWFEATTGAPIWKLIYNRSGEYWRTVFVYNEFLRYKSNSKERAAFDTIGGIVVDEIHNRGSINWDPVGGPANYHVGFDPELFSLSRFLEYGK